MNRKLHRRIGLLLPSIPMAGTFANTLLQKISLYGQFSIFFISFYHQISCHFTYHQSTLLCLSRVILYLKQQKSHISHIVNIVQTNSVCRCIQLNIDHLYGLCQIINSSHQNVLLISDLTPLINYTRNY